MLATTVGRQSVPERGDDPEAYATMTPRSPGRRIKRRLTDRPAPAPHASDDLQATFPHPPQSIDRPITVVPGVGRRIDRRLTHTPAQTANTSDDLKVSFPHPPQSRARLYDLGSLGLPSDVADLLAHAVRNHLEPIVHQTQVGLWESIRTFARFVLEDQQVQSVADLNTAMVGRYRLWIDRQRNKRAGTPWSQTTRAKKMVDLRTLMRTLKVVSPERLKGELVFPAFCYSDREPRLARCQLNKAQLESLTWCCRKEINEILERFETGQKILAGDKSTDCDPALYEVLEAIRELNMVGRPSEDAMSERGLTSKMLKRFGGLTHLRSYLSLTDETASPFYLFLLTALAGNIEPVLKLTRDCVSPDSIDEELDVIEWVKPRAGPAPGSIQQRFFKRDKRYSPPKLIKHLVNLTDPLVSRVPPRDQDKLFLCYRHKKGTFGLMSYVHMASQVKRFLLRAAQRIDTWNREYPGRRKTELPVFELRELRGAVAIQHFLAEDGDILSAQRVLNHRSPDTTDGYITGPLTRDLNWQIMASIQSELVDNLCNPPSESGPSSLPGGTASASFGNDCRNPLLPSLAGPQLCHRFQQCFDCRGLAIPIDAQHLARLLRAKVALEADRERLPTERWDLYYAGSYRKLVDEIEPLFPKELFPEARALMATLIPLPNLE